LYNILWPYLSTKNAIAFSKPNLLLGIAFLVSLLIIIDCCLYVLQIVDANVFQKIFSNKLCSVSATSLFL